ncbi:uncharacterized protein LOC110452412 [Mizuhopecten yessoensis]|uniref:uncharacterized protein LOC110452412 n=1 Tax=Mizuhopecten yessoensis TaxID=6573 RepID=UPI000B45796D|nr:uncharacterized protein LOC110452412 [Mizuhopecten yessoensis]
MVMPMRYKVVQYRRQHTLTLVIMKMLFHPNFAVVFLCAFSLCNSSDVSMYFTAKVPASGNFEGSTGNGLMETFANVVTYSGCGSICVYRGTCMSFIADNTTAQCQIFDRILWRQETPAPQAGAVYFQKVFFTCPSNYIYYLGYCIKEYTTLVTWMMAHEQCQKDGGLLFHFSTVDRHNYYKTIMNTNNVYHIGGFKQGGNWIWTTGDLLSGGFSNMVSTVSPGLCLTVDATGSWQWDAIDCNVDLHKYLCEISVFTP